MTSDQLISILATITLFELMVAIGLSVTVAEIVSVARNWRMVCRAVLANYILVPAAAMGLLMLFRAHPMVAAGFLVIAACPGAPYGPPFTAMVKGNVIAAVGLMVILAGSSAILAPLLLQVLLPVIAKNEPISINLTKMIGTLALSQFLPLCVGIYVRERHPALAAKVKRPASQLSMVFNLLLVGIILVVQFPMLAAIRPMGYVGMLALLTAALFAGWALGGPEGDDRKAMLMATSVRNVGVGLVIAAASFPGTPAVTAATAYALIQSIVMALVAFAWGRWTVHRGTAVAGSPSEVPTSPLFCPKPNGGPPNGPQSTVKNAEPE